MNNASLLKAFVYQDNIFFFFTLYFIFIILSRIILYLYLMLSVWWFSLWNCCIYTYINRDVYENISEYIYLNKYIKYIILIVFFNHILIKSFLYTVFTDMSNKMAWKECFVVDEIRLPTGYYIGISGTTGDLSDNHDILSIRLFELDSNDVSTYFF